MWLDSTTGITSHQFWFSQGNSGGKKESLGGREGLTWLAWFQAGASTLWAWRMSFSQRDLAGFKKNTQFLGILTCNFPDVVLSALCPSDTGPKKCTWPLSAKVFCPLGWPVVVLWTSVTMDRLCPGQTSPQVHKKHSFLSQQLRQCRQLPPRPPHSEVQPWLITARTLRRGTDTHPLYLWHGRGHSGGSQRSSPGVPLTWFEVEGSTLLLSTSVFDRKNRHQQVDYAPKKVLHEINNSECLGGQGRVMRTILDYLLPVCCSGGQAPPFEVRMRLSPFTLGPRLELIQNNLHFNIPADEWWYLSPDVKLPLSHFLYLVASFMF